MESEKKLRIIVLFIVLVLLSSRLCLFTGRNTGLYENEGADYPSLSLAHGINFDFRMGAGFYRFISNDQTTHPGIPFQLVSGIAYKAAALFSDGDKYETALSMAVTPDRFWLFNQAAAFLLFLVSLYILYTIGRRNGMITAVMMICAYLSFSQVWVYGYHHLGIESFTIILFALLTYFVKKTCTAPERSLYWFAIGAVCGLCYLNKLHYIAWFAAALVFSAVFSYRYGTKRSLKFFTFLFFGFAATVFCVGGVYLGFRGLTDMLVQHAMIVSPFENNRSAIIHYGAMTDVLKAYLTKSNLLIFLESAAVLLLAGYKVLSMRKRSGDGTLPYFVFLSSAMILSFIFALSRRGTHYLMLFYSILPFVLAMMAPMISRRSRIVLTTVFAMTAVLLGSVYINYWNSLHTKSIELHRELDYVRSLPVAENEYRVWARRTLCMEYYANSVMEFSNIPGLRERLNKVMPRESSCTVEVPENINWKYTVYPTSVYPDFSSLPASVRDRSNIIFDGSFVLVVQKK